ncbi:MAG: PepSY domain-containing protein [Acutalibacteraceae bacterium]|nr:PepSY domain-containing protein [Acutalibacteraceae bacterium]
MKKNLRKVLAIALAIVSLFSLSISAFAADISADKAKGIALKDAGYSAQEVIRIKAEYEVDDGRKVWNVDFLAEDEKGRVVDYDYEISAADGRILERDWEFEDDFYPDREDRYENAFEALFRKFVQWLLSLFR